MSNEKSTPEESLEQNSEVLFVVLKLSTKLTIQSGAEEVDMEVGGCAGFLPVYKTLEEAETIAEQKYQITAIRIVREQPADE